MTSRKTPQQLSAERRIAREKWQAEEFPKLSEEKQKNILLLNILHVQNKGVRLF